MTTTNPSASTRSRPRPEPRLVSRAGRFLGAAALLAIAVVAVLENAAYRGFEALVAGVFVRPFTDHNVSSSGDVFWIADASSVTGFRITAECTGIILVAPLVVLSAVFLLVTRAPAWRIITGATAMWVVVTLINEVRLALIGYSTMTWGTDRGYTISHTFVGSAIGILGFAAGLAVMILVSMRGARRGR